MAQRRFHYEQAFEQFLRSNRIPYVAVDEARKALLPEGAGPDAVKSFDFVVYAEGRNLLVDVKGRMFGSATSQSSLSDRRFESWVTAEDVDGLKRWKELFGEEFEAVFVFAYCLRQQPPDALFETVFAHGGRWYALREVGLADYRQNMVQRSAKWATVHLPAEAYRRVSRPLRIRPPAGCESTERVIC